MIEEFLLNPNLQYLFLVSGFILALLAIITPGTGLFELGAFFALLLAGYGIYNLPINYWALIVLIASIFPFVWAVRKSEQWGYLGAAILAVVLGSAYLFRGEVWWQPAVNPVLALVTSILAGGFLWLLTRKTLEARAMPVSHDIDSVRGAIGEAKSKIYHEGSVQVLGELWAARSETPIAEGTIIRVIKRDGFVLEVEEKRE